MRGRFGFLDWWPAKTPFEVMVGAILTQNTAWTNVERAVEGLRRAGLLEPEPLARARLPEIASAIRPSGYFNQKALRLRLMAAHVRDVWDCDLEAMYARDSAQVRDELLSLKGIGPETADSMLLYAGCHPVFVIDAYTIRVCERTGLARGLDYAGLQSMFMDSLGPDAPLYNDFHAQYVELGKNHCRPVPRCGACPLLNLCDTGRRCQNGDAAGEP